MATLQNIRNRGGVALAVFIGLALGAFILGDLFKSGSSFMRGKAMEIAEISGKTVNYNEYQARVDELTNVYKMNTGRTSLDENTTYQVREQAWQNMVRTYVMEDIYSELGVDVTSEELFDMVQGKNIHPMIQQIFRDPKTGQVNRSAIIQFLKSLETGANQQQQEYWLFLENQIKSDRRMEKYNTMVSKGLYATELEAKQDLNSRNNLFDFEYVRQPFTALADDKVELKDSDLKAYYEANKETYKHDETRQIEYVAFPVKASEQDDVDTKKWIEDLKSEFQATENVASFVGLNSETPYNESYAKESELSPELATFAFAGKEGDIYGPYKETNSWKMAKIVSFKDLPDSVNARHILLQVQNATQAATAQTLADSLKTQIESGKLSFAKAAKENSKDPGSAQKGGDLGWFRRGMMVKPFEDAAFLGKKGDIQIVASQFGIHIIEVLKKGKTSKNVQLAVVDREISASSRTYQDIYSKASKFAAECANGKEFASAVEKEGVSSRSATVRAADRTIPGLNSSRQIIRSAFQNTEISNMITDNEGGAIFELDDRFVVARLASISEEGISPFAEVKSRIEYAVRKEKKAEMLAANLKGNTLEQIVTDNNLKLESVKDANFSNNSVAGLGVEPAVIGAASMLDANGVSKPVIGNNGVFVVRVTAKNQGSDTDVKGVKNQLTQANSYRANYSALNELREAANVEDMRSKFY